MSDNTETKWMNRRGTWKYIPDRYQATVATIVSAFLYFNLFETLFGREQGRDGNCGSFFRPTLSESAQYADGWFWHSFQDAFSNYAESFEDGSIQTLCSGTWGTAWWEALATAGALAICGVVLRRAITREDATKTE